MFCPVLLMVSIVLGYWLPWEPFTLYEHFTPNLRLFTAYDSFKSNPKLDTASRCSVLANITDQQRHGPLVALGTAHTPQTLHTQPSSALANDDRHLGPLIALGTTHTPQTLHTQPSSTYSI